MIEAYGSDDMNTFDNARKVATILRTLNCPEEAEAPLVVLLARSETVLGINDNFTLAICHSLAEVFYDRRDYVKAGKLYRRPYLDHYEKHGMENVSTLNCVMGLANVTGNLGD